MWRHVAAGKNRESRCHNRSCRSPPSHVSTKIGTDIENTKYLPTNGGTGIDENATNKKVVGGLPGRNARRRRLETKIVYYTSIFLLCIPILIDNSQRQPNWGPTHRTLPAWKSARDNKWLSSSPNDTRRGANAINTYPIPIRMTRARSGGRKDPHHEPQHRTPKRRRRKRDTMTAKSPKRRRPKALHHQPKASRVHIRMPGCSQQRSRDILQRRHEKDWALDNSSLEIVVS